MPDPVLTLQSVPPAIVIQAPEQKGGVKRTIVRSLITGSVLLNFWLFMVLAAALGGGERMIERTVAGEGDAKIALIPLSGTIQSGGGGMGPFKGPDMIEAFRRQLDRAAKDPAVKGVLLEINSPGGGLTASDILARRVEAFRKETKKPVLALISDLGASGGYMVALSADKVWAHPTSIVGSIGVIMMGFDLQGLSEKIGVKDRTWKSSKSGLKDMLSPFRDPTPEEKALVQGLLDEYHDRFIEEFRASRKMTKEEALKLADGRIYTAAAALKLKMLDALGYREDAFADLKKTAGVPTAKLVRYERPAGLAGMLSGWAPAAAPQAAIPGPSEILDAALPRLWAIWPGP